VSVHLCVVAEDSDMDPERDGERLYQNWCREQGKRDSVARFDSDADRAELLLSNLTRGVYHTPSPRSEKIFARQYGGAGRRKPGGTLGARKYVPDCTDTPPLLAVS
jgi:hypothetical protein